MSRPFTVIVAGRDAPLWLAAAALARGLAPSGVQVEAVELPSALASVDAHATFPALEALHNQLRIDETMLLRATGGNLTLGRNFTDLAGAWPAFLHAYGSAGTQIGGRDFFAHWVKARAHGLGVPLDDFSLTAAAARQGRLMLPDAENAIYGRCDYGYHLPAIPYARLLRAAAIGHGATAHAAEQLTVERAGDAIVALDLGAGRRLAADLFVDAGGVLGGAHLSWRAHFPVDRVLTAAGPPFANIPVYAEDRAGPTGWTALHPGRPATFVVHAWSSAHATDEEALRAAGAAAGLPLAGVRIAAVEPGRPARPWTGNCVTLGAVFDPVHGLDLLGLQVGLVQLLADFPATAHFAAERDEYNRAAGAALDRLRDFQSAHYALARYAGPFWDAARAGTVSPDLAHAVALFRARAELAPFEEENLPPDSWRALFLGHGVEPESWPPAIDRVPPEEAKAQFRRMLGFVREQVLRQPTQEAYLAGLADG
ncbi:MULTISPECIES: tryptophan 7-halogenase [unclassified Sphingomonas]|uniref:tryptophan 7-halogenase n=1 Tax=Sphingomonas TaxID=13687 RepID=UPI000967597B|nr:MULTISPECIES: tryptophan 7-halogenase [unclassified Sphingomonas]MBN8813414.1 tryptophan 7-halogenase [Sphingomonas sp.]OJY52918.1 MAG: tryptophan halogenase [Sphingomonas sp. 67-41]